MRIPSLLVVCGLVGVFLAAAALISPASAAGGFAWLDAILDSFQRLARIHRWEA